MQFLIQLGELLSALVAKAAFQLAVALCITAVYNGAVGLGCTHGNVVCFFKQGDIQFVAA